MSTLFKILALIILLAGLTYVGACVYANFINPSGSGEVDAPDFSEAPYYVVIENTGNVFFTANYELFGNVYVLHGYWEKVGNGFKYRDKDLILDQAVFGQISIRTRGRMG